MDQERKATLITRMTLSRLKLERATDAFVEATSEATHQIQLLGNAMMTANALSGGALFRGELG